METPADIEDPTSASFVVLAVSTEGKPIFFHRSEASSSNSSLESFQNEGMPQLSLNSPMAQAIMKKMCYNTQNPIGLGGGRGILTPLEPTLTKSQLEDWKLHHHVDKSSHGLGYDPDTPPRQWTQGLQNRFADKASTSRVDENIDLPGYLFEELPIKDPGSSSNWYNFSNDEEKLSDDTNTRFFYPEEPSSPKEDWDHLIASLERITDQEDSWTEAEPWSENALGTPEGLAELEALREVKGLQKRLVYIRRFISDLSGKCRPFSRLMKKVVDFIWDTECEAAFQDIKSYLTKPPVLVAPTTEKPFILYTRAIEHSLEALLAQENDEGKEVALYHLSCKLVGVEHRYSLVEKECMAVMFAVQKLRHYLMSNTIYLISRINLLKVLVTKAGSHNARLAKWSILLSQFDIRYVPQKAIKGQALADFLGKHPLPKDSPLMDDLPDEHVYNVEKSSPNAS
ncbi:hypothetical protein MRB53_010491 [Persea americana]|uniref:Uncharacterized protein n=1 Tax=Persea americana TaxID=3435 RepID=A0ACC2LT57_PERAE|nr:hypothetical protein MRB53_010491 [Persea americana]